MSEYAGLLIKCKDRYLLCKRAEGAVGRVCLVGA